jgi:hypothetical protein
MASSYFRALKAHLLSATRSVQRLDFYPQVPRVQVGAFMCTTCQYIVPLSSQSA